MKRYAHKIRDSSKEPPPGWRGFSLCPGRSWPGFYLYTLPPIRHGLGPSEKLPEVPDPRPRTPPGCPENWEPP